jgi:uncharacterized membrane protein YphA (DoxX/SURF4 family)
MPQILSLFPNLFDYQLAAPFILRLVLAFIFIGHGYSKLFKNREETAQFFESIKIKPGKFWTKLVGFFEFASGLLLLIGLFVQAAAIAISFIMIVAIVKVKRKEGFLGGYEFDLLILAAALALLVLGPGIFSFDLPL